MCLSTHPSEAGDARVYGDASKTPIAISGLAWHVTIADRQMVIGCQAHDISAWWDFDDRIIADMDGRAALKFWRDHKATLQAICAATGRPFAAAEKPAEPVEA